MRVLSTGQVVSTTAELTKLETALEKSHAESFATAVFAALFAASALPLAGGWSAPACWGILIGCHWGIAGFWDWMDREEGRRPLRSLGVYHPKHAWALVLAALIASPLEGFVFGGTLIASLHGLYALHCRWMLADIAIVFSAPAGLPRFAAGAPAPRPARVRPVSDTSGLQACITEIAPRPGAACRICGDDLGSGDLMACTRCETPHHRTCWYYNRGCSVYGCDSKECVPVVCRSAC